MSGTPKKYRKSDHPHPLEPLVMKSFAEAEEVYASSLPHAKPMVSEWSVARQLSGADNITSPGGSDKGNRAYSIVASDVLGFMVCAGRLVRHGSGNKRCPEKGGFYYTLTDKELT